MKLVIWCIGHMWRGDNGVDLTIDYEWYTKRKALTELRRLNRHESHPYSLIKTTIEMVLEGGDSMACKGKGGKKGTKNPKGGKK